MTVACPRNKNDVFAIEQRMRPGMNNINRAKSDISNSHHSNAKQPEAAIETIIYESNRHLVDTKGGKRFSHEQFSHQWIHSIPG